MSDHLSESRYRTATKYQQKIPEVNTFKTKRVKASNAKQIGNTTTTTSNSFDALGSMGDMDEDMGSKRVENGADQHVAKMVMSSVNEVETKEDNGKLGSLRMIWLKIQGKKNVEPKRKSCLSPDPKHKLWH
ncbi:hypothetical protein Tco_1196321 [Tanacetum coccineum]